jgi:phosphoribosylamine--glycine ligase
LKILIIGSGGREHALAWRLAKSPDAHTLLASPGNPGIEEIATCLPVPARVEDYAALAEAHQVNLTVVGPEAPLVAGIVDEFNRRRLKIIGPTQAAARLEGSKIFAKEFFRRAGIPTARSGRTVSDFAFPVVIKADGLAAGKGVVIANTKAEADEAVARLGPNLVIEEFLDGEEVSFIGLSDGRSIIPFAPTQDHKRAYDGDQGPNTGGMGAYADTRILTSAQTGDIMERIMLPAIRQMQNEGTPFTGFLYAGIMMTGGGPKVLEFNVRLGDPETQALMHSFEGELAAFLQGDASAGAWNSPSVCVVVAANGYPGTPRIGDPIQGIAEAEATGATVYQAGTRRQGDDVVTNGGRVLGVTAAGATLQSAIDNAYQATTKIRFVQMHYRQDIGQKGLQRWAR